MITPPAALEAVLFASGEPVEKKQLSKLLDINDAELAITIKSLSESLQGRGIALVETSKEVEMRTSPEASVIVKKLRESELSRDLGKASMETLAVIAYQTGTTRGEIDWVRGVNSSASLRTLLIRGLIDGREDERDKRRTRYSLTTDALAYLGVSKIEDLPRAKELSPTVRVVIEEESVSGVEETL